MILKNISTRHMCVYLVATDYDNTYVKIIGEHTFKDAIKKYGKAEVLKVEDGIHMTRVTLLDEDYEGWKIIHDKEEIN